MAVQPNYHYWHSRVIEMLGTRWITHPQMFNCNCHWVNLKLEILGLMMTHPIAYFFNCDLVSPKFHADAKRVYDSTNLVQKHRL